MSTTRRWTTIAAAFLLVGTVLYVAHRQGQRKADSLSKADFIAKADAVCTDARLKVQATTVPAINISGAVSKDRQAWLDGVERRRKVLVAEIARLRKLVPPSDFRKKWTGVVNDLDAAASAILDLEDAVRHVSPSAANELISGIEAIGVRSSKTMRAYGLEVCSQPSFSSPASGNSS
ncbi:MAG: hypothetical protein U0V73_03985 [Acidimicrobiia bacterium]